MLIGVRADGRKELIALTDWYRESAQARWRCVNAPHLVALVRAGATFVNGKLVERDPVLEAAQTAGDTPVQAPAASNQPVSNAA